MAYTAKLIGFPMRRSPSGERGSSTNVEINRDGGVRSQSSGVRSREEIKKEVFGRVSGTEFYRAIKRT
ncbi:MAG: hypothetical protein F6K48_03495 [Okeania sp. SIO3H1]|nr:hypothetical protein [Okeania sp. SIO3H1]